MKGWSMRILFPLGASIFIVVSATCWPGSLEMRILLCAYYERVRRPQVKVKKHWVFRTLFFEQQSRSSENYYARPT